MHSVAALRQLIGEHTVLLVWHEVWGLKEYANKGGVTADRHHQHVDNARSLITARACTAEQAGERGSVFLVGYRIPASLHLLYGFTIALTLKHQAVGHGAAGI